MRGGGYHQKHPWLHLLRMVNEMDHKPLWLELKDKLQKDASFYREKSKKREDYLSKNYYAGHHDYAGDILKWRVEQEKVEGEPKTSEAHEDRERCEETITLDGDETVNCVFRKGHGGKHQYMSIVWDKEDK